MVEYFDFGANLEALIRTWKGDDVNTEPKKKGESYTSDYIQSNSASRRRRQLDSSFLQVRESVCLVGFDRDAILGVKTRINKLMEEPIPLESFHIKTLSDIKDGALLVPKLIFVAVHCPGKVLIDEEGNHGQLDHLYDEACEIGADIMVIYMGLPISIYPPMKRIVYHPKMAEILFPTQTILRELAENNSLVTVTENSEFTHMQRNVIREWLSRPVNNNHQVYKTASRLTSLEMSYNDLAFWSESEAPESRYARRAAEWEFDIAEPNFISATEEHPLADKAAKKKKKKGKKKLTKREKSARENTLIDIDDPDEIEEFSAGARGGMEMDMYRDNYNNNDEFSYHMTNSL